MVYIDRFTMAMLCLGILCFGYLAYFIGSTIIEQSKEPEWPDGPFKILDKKIEPHWVLWPIYSFDTYWFQYHDSKYCWIEIDQADYEAYQVGDWFRQIYTIYH